MLTLQNKLCNFNVMEKYYMLTIIKEVEPYRLPGGQTNKAFLCLCDCGVEKIVRKSHLVRGKIKSCGCKNKTQSGLSAHKLYKTLQAIKLRTNGHYDDVYKRKGIKLCDEWNDFLTFYNWAINAGYKKGLQIDRIDGNLNYEPSNCRFVTPKQNCNNRENTFFVVYKNKTFAFTELIEIKNLQKNEGAIRGRIKRNWSIEKAFDTPLRQGNYKKEKNN
jgi:hypothetical protein